MLKYNCHKTVHAEPMELGAYNLYKGWTLPAGEDPTKPGYLVIYNGGEERQHISWSPKDVFEEGYTTVSETLTFGEALIALRKGQKLTRRGWSRGDQFVYYVPGGHYPAQTDVGKSIGNFVEYREYLALKTAKGDVATWSPTTSDALATDWDIIA